MSKTCLLWQGFFYIFFFGNFIYINITKLNGYDDMINTILLQAEALSITCCRHIYIVSIFSIFQIVHVVVSRYFFIDSPFMFCRMAFFASSQRYFKEIFPRFNYINTFEYYYKPKNVQKKVQFCQNLEELMDVPLGSGIWNIKLTFLTGTLKVKIWKSQTPPLETLMMYLNCVFELFTDWIDWSTAFKVKISKGP